MTNEQLTEAMRTLDITCEELAEKIFDVVMKTDHAGFGARAVDIALRGLFQFEQFPEAFSASSDLTNHMLSRGHIKLEVVEL